MTVLFSNRNKVDQRVNNLDIKKVSFAGVIITLGVVFGALGTSPLYVMKAIVSKGSEFNELLIYGSLSCIFWTLTLQTTIKYILITLRANKKGEGGIFALFALLKRKPSLAAILAMVGAGALFADGVITPAITVTSSVEGFRLFNDKIPVIEIVLLIFVALFFFQRYGTNMVGAAFGPIMIIWFSMLSVLGISQLVVNPGVLEALNPVYAVRFLSEYPGGFILLGSVFLATTGAEALYSDLGRCGIKNIRVSWIFVKTALLLNYFGQGAWILMNGHQSGTVNPFYGIMPDWFLIPGIIIATAAAVITSQAIISGSYTLIGEAISLNFWPKIKILNPTRQKGQVYVPYVNWFLWIGCSFVVVLFRESSNMEAAYGLSITLTMIMTTLILSYYLYQKGVARALVILLLLSYLTIETGFLIANLHKFRSGGWFTLLLASMAFIIMYGWYFGRKLKNRYLSFSKLENYHELFKDLSADTTIPNIATNLVYIIKANDPEQVESKVIHSIFSKQPKRAKTYWLIHVDRTDEPERFEYKVTHIIPGLLLRVDFMLGFKIEPKINLYFKEVIEDLIKSGEIKSESCFDCINKHSLPPDFRFILIDRVMPLDAELPFRKRLILRLHSISRLLALPETEVLQMDVANTFEERVPLTVNRLPDQRISRIKKA